MPRQYVAMRDSFAEQGMDYDKAQAKAAAIYNAKHPGAPVTSASHESDKADEVAHRAKHAKEPDADERGGKSDKDADDTRARIKKKLKSRK